MKAHTDDRISFSCVEYHVRHPDGRIEVSLYPPTCESHPAPPIPVPLDSVGKAEMIARGEVKPIPSSLPYRIVVNDLAEFNRLDKTGILHDPRHTGANSTLIDNRTGS